MQKHIFVFVHQVFAFINELIMNVDINTIHYNIIKTIVQKSNECYMKLAERYIPRQWRSFSMIAILLLLKYCLPMQCTKRVYKVIVGDI